MTDFRLLMIGAVHENGGNMTHRFLDGHPQLFVYPYESQVGTRLVDDHLSSLVAAKYRWPTFALHAEPDEDFRAIIDEETKIRARTPNVSKFRDHPFDLDDDERRARYVEIIGETGRSRANNVAAFFRATFDVWRDLERSGEEQVYVGYSPTITVDAATILDDYEDAHFLHVVRNPWSAYADTKKRPVPLALETYMLGWTLNQYFAVLLRERHPDRLHVVRAEDVMADSRRTLSKVLDKMGLHGDHAALETPTWNGRQIGEVYPWGTIRTATPEANLATAQELSAGEQEQIRRLAWPYLDVLDYGDFLATTDP